MWAVLGSMAAVGAAVVLALLRAKTELEAWEGEKWNRDEHEYPARPTGEPSPRAGLDDD